MKEYSQLLNLDRLLHTLIASVPRIQISRISRDLIQSTANPVFRIRLVYLTKKFIQLAIHPSIERERESDFILFSEKYHVKDVTKRYVTRKKIRSEVFKRKVYKYNSRQKSWAEFQMQSRTRTEFNNAPVCAVSSCNGSILDSWKIRKVRDGTTRNIKMSIDRLGEIRYSNTIYIINIRMLENIL